jgi:hypothetical protein
MPLYMFIAILDASILGCAAAFLLEKHLAE